VLKSGVEVPVFNENSACIFLSLRQIPDSIGSRVKQQSKIKIEKRNVKLIFFSSLIIFILKDKKEKRENNVLFLILFFYIFLQSSKIIIKTNRKKQN
jgi:hypothetical protein